MKKNIAKIELYLSRLLVMSMSVLWYPLFVDSSVKLHHVILVALTIIATFSGNLIKYLYQTIRLKPVFAIGIIGWVVTLFITTTLFPTTWTPVKVISFFIQVMLGNYSIYCILKHDSFGGLKRLLNISIFLFPFPFFLFSGIPLGEVADIIVRTIIEANPKIIIGEFMKQAPIFQSFYDDGLDGFRHTISMYFVLVLLVNLVQFRKRFDIVIILGLIGLIAVFQSRAAWLALLIPLLALFLSNVLLTKRTILRWAIVACGVFSFVGFFITIFAPLIIVRLVHLESYVGRLNRLSEAFDFIGDLSLVPITLNRIFGSSHMFIFDSYYSGGFIGFVFACLLVFAILRECIPKWKISGHYWQYGFCFAIPFIVRLFTAGSGLPGIGASLAFSVALYLNTMPKVEPEL